MNSPIPSVAHALAWQEMRCRAGVREPTAFVHCPQESCVVLGLAQEAERELHLDALAADSVKAYRRSSGGGAVLLGPGVVTFGVFAPPDTLGPETDLRGTFRHLLAPMIDTCAALGVPVHIAGISDLAATLDNGTAVKVCGCAQQRKRGAVLVHGSLLVDADIRAFARYLRFPSDVPDYRAGRAHHEFCRTLNDLGTHPITPGDVTEQFHHQIMTRGWAWLDMPTALPEEGTRLKQELFDNPDWNLRRIRPGRRA